MEECYLHRSTLVKWQAKVTKWTILWNLKIRLEKEWGHDSSGIETPFKLSFKMELVVLVKILNEIDRMKVKPLNVVAKNLELDLLEEIRERIAVKTTTYKQKGLNILI